MMISRVSIPVLSKSLFSLVISIVLTACSTEENIGASAGGVQGTIGSGQIALSWVAPAEREDGTPISMAEIAGYRVYYGTSQGVYTNQVDISDGDTMLAVLSGLTAGTYYLVVTTVDMDGRESGFSQTVTRNI